VTRILDESDIRAGRPLDRKTLRSTEEGYLCQCNAHGCEWEMLVPSIEIAEAAANTHIYRQRRHQDASHVGRCVAEVIDLDSDRARRQGDNHHVYIGEVGPREPLAFDGEFGPWYPRATDDLDALVHRGDRIKLSWGDDRHGKVARVSATRSGGIATWSVVYADPGTDLTRNDWQPKFKNELIARDGAVYCRYGEEFLGAPDFEVVGETDHQADFTEFAGATSDD